VLAVETESGVSDLGTARHVDALVALGELTAGDVSVQLLHGVIGANDEITEPAVVAMEAVGREDAGGRRRYRGSFVCERAGRYGFTVRVVPHHPDLLTPVEMGLIAWA